MARPANDMTQRMFMIDYVRPDGSIIMSTMTYTEDDLETVRQKETKMAEILQSTFGPLRSRCF